MVEKCGKIAIKTKKLSQIKNHKSTKIHSQTPLQNHLNPLAKTYKTQETTSHTKSIKYTKPNVSQIPTNTTYPKNKNDLNLRNA